MKIYLVSKAHKQIMQYVPHRLFASVLFLLTLTITLIFGLFPHDNYSKNWISWSDDQNATLIGKYGLAHGSFPHLTNLHGTNNNLEILLTIVPENTMNSSFQVIAQIKTADDNKPLIIGQWQTYFIVLQGNDYSDRLKQPRLTTNITDWIGEEIEIRILLNDNVNTLYVNGTPVSTHAPSTYDIAKEYATISIGNTLDGKKGWTGAISNFKINFEDTSTITQTVLREYDFSSNNLPTSIIDISKEQSNLTIPEPGRFPESLFLNDRKVEKLVRISPFDLFINVLGFVPIAIACALLLSSKFLAIKYWQIMITTILFCSSISLTIESTQQFIPGRNSDLHDLILNIAGALVGLVIYQIARKAFITSNSRPSE